MDKVIRTGMRIGDAELLLSPGDDHILDTAWFNVRTGRYDRLPDEENRSAYGNGHALTFFEVRERPAPDGRLITYGFASAQVASVTIEQQGFPITRMSLAPWGADRNTTVFWVSRGGTSILKTVPDPQRAVCTLYGPSGQVIDRLMIKEPNMTPRDG